MITTGFVDTHFQMAEDLFYSYLLRLFFIMNWCSILSNIFSASIKMIVYLSFFLLMWSDTITGFSCIENYLANWNTLHLVMMTYILLDLICYYFVQVLFNYPQGRNWYVTFLSCNALANYPMRDSKNTKCYCLPKVILQIRIISC